MPLRIAVPTAAATLLAIGLAAAPARAQPAPDVVGGLIATALAGVVIGSILSDRADDATKAAPEVVHPVHRRAHRRHGHGPRAHHRHGYGPRARHHRRAHRWHRRYHQRWAPPRWRRGHHDDGPRFDGGGLRVEEPVRNREGRRRHRD